MNATTETERRLISACMAGGPICVAGAVGMGVSVESFTDGALAAIWAGLTTAATEDRQTSAFYVLRRTYGANIDAVAVERLREISHLEPTSVYAKTLAADVVGEAKRRNVILRLSMALSAAKASESWDDAWAKTSDAMREAQQAAAAHAVTADLDALVDAYIAEELSGKPPGTVGLGIDEFDEFFGLLAPGEVCVMAGRPGVGKTALALQMADATVRSGRSAVIISLEMSGKDLVGRLAKQRAGRAAAIVRGCSKADYQNAKEARVTAAKAIKANKGRLHIFEVQEAGSVSRIEDRVAMLASADQLPDVVVIDYLQLIHAEDSRAPREQQVATMSRKLKLMALTYKVPVILLSQLNRDAEKNDRKPRLSDLRESGSIEQDADRVWLIYPDAEVPSAPDSPSVGVMIDQAKNRNGAGGIAKPARFFKPAFLFEKP